MNSKIIITGHVLADRTLEELAHKLEKVLRHNRHIVRIRLDLHDTGLRAGERYYTAKAVVELRGPDLVVSTTTGNLYRSVNLVVEKLDRMLSERVHKMEDRRRHPHGIDVPSLLPKTG